MDDHGGGPPAASGSAPDVPAMPAIWKRERIDFPTPVAFDGKRPAIGWHFRDPARGGPCFVIMRAGALGQWKVLERFPLSDDGWRAAWLHFAASAGAPVPETLAALAARAEAAAEAAARKGSTVASIAGAAYLGGYGAALGLIEGQPYDVRFLDDRIAVHQPGTAARLQEISYREVEDLEIGGPGIVSKLSRGQQAGAAALFGLLGAAVAYGSTKIQTVIHVQATDVDLYFLCTTTVPDALRIQLAEALGAIRQARAQRATGQAALVPGEITIASELDKLAGLLDRGLLTREEFDQFKARLLAGP